MDQNNLLSAPESLSKCIAKMKQAALPETAIDLFSHYYRQLTDNIPAIIPESSISPVSANDIDDAEDLQKHAATGADALDKTVVIKLNGGLGTTMGLQGPKSLIKVKNGLSFLDISIRQIRHLNDRQRVKIPLVLMNSFFTDAATREVISACSDLPAGLIEMFLQHKFPKVLTETLGPLSCPEQPFLEWNPAGHGDLLISLETSGLLERLLRTGYRYLFVSNIDNLGAEINTDILGYFSSSGLDFLMEVTDRTPMDRKGGHLALSKNTRFALRESAQCSAEDRNRFSDISVHKFFNTNNIWLNLESVRKVITSRKYRDMPLIINRKILNQLDPGSPAVIHLESALGSAIQIFEKCGVVRVPRSRFAPVKSCDELIIVQSDYYQLPDDCRIRVNPATTSGRVVVTLDPQFFSRIDLIESRFPGGVPSLVDCASFSVKGDVKFGANITLHGSVSITNTSGRQVSIEDNSDISGDLFF
jgi:UTP--glucose-1-phosphate uridylyltransferase